MSSQRFLAAAGGADPQADRSFEDPGAVEPSEDPVAPRNAGLVHRFPRVAVTRLAIELG